MNNVSDKLVMIIIMITILIVFGLIGKDGVNYFKSYFLEIYEKTTPDKNFSR